MKKCPYCAEEIQDEAIVCRFCGNKLKGGIKTSNWIAMGGAIFSISLLIWVAYNLSGSRLPAIQFLASLTPSPTSTNTPSPTLPPTATLTPDPCPYNDAVIFYDEIVSILKDYTNAIQLLAITDDTSKLLGQSRMIEIMNRTAQLEYPPCGEPVYNTALAFMNSGLDWSNSMIKHETPQQVDAKLQKFLKDLQDCKDAIVKFQSEAGITK